MKAKASMKMKIKKVKPSAWVKVGGDFDGMELELTPWGYKDDQYIREKAVTIDNKGKPTTDFSYTFNHFEEIMLRRVKNWKNVVDDEGKAIPFNENKELLLEYTNGETGHMDDEGKPKVLFQLIDNFVRDKGNFVQD